MPLKNQNTSRWKSMRHGIAIPETLRSNIYNDCAHTRLTSAKESTIVVIIVVIKVKKYNPTLCIHHDYCYTKS